MPELPEVETVVRTLEKQIKGRKITGVDIYWPKVVADGGPEAADELRSKCHWLQPPPVS